MNKHWAEQIADELIKKRKPPFVIGSGGTPSGPAHLGTLCELLYPSKVRDVLIKKGQKTDVYFVADILDAFDSIPLVMQKYEKELTPYLGKPLAHVPDPTGKSRSFGEHFLDEIKEIMKKFQIKSNIIRSDELYASGKVDKYAKLFLRHKQQVKTIIENTSKKQEKEDWNPIIPICEQCGKIATTKVISYTEDEYVYECTRDTGYTKGCGFKGKNLIQDHKYKLVWRIHWAMWQDLLNTSYEGAGVDHFTKGGSRDTLNVIFKEIFKKEPSIGYKFGFIFIHGKKYSKSKGLGMSLSELMQILPPEIITFILIRPDLEENKNIVPTKENLIRMIEEYEQSQQFSEKELEKLHKAERKRAFAYLLAGKRHWKASFKDILIYYSIYSDWNKVGEMLNDKQGVSYLKPYIEEWVKKDLIPEELNFKYSPKKAQGKLKEFFSSLDENLNESAIHNKIFEFAENTKILPKELFKQIYFALIGKEKGPRLGKLIFALGIRKIKKDVGC